MCPAASYQLMQVVCLHLAFNHMYCYICQ